MPSATLDLASPQSLLPLLIVDDDEGIRRTFAQILGRAGHTVDTAASGEAAIEALGREQFAALICDVRMPGIDGLSVLRRARELDPQVMLIVISAVDDAATALAALRAGAAEYLTKPIDRETLEATVGRTLAERESKPFLRRSSFSRLQETQAGAEQIQITNSEGSSAGS